MQIIKTIQNRIYEIRGERVMIDRDLAALYEVETKHLNEAVKRNLKRFPGDFMFQLTKDEYDEHRLLMQKLENDNAFKPKMTTVKTEDDSLRSQIATLKKVRGSHSKYLPYAFTEQGVAMLSGILNSDKAISMNIAIMRVFVEVRKILLKENDMKEQFKQIKERLGEHDIQLNQIYDAMENLLDEKAAERKWNDRERIGFTR
ncbi:MAG: ORF6N domain-containing protein [Aquabacterium sp.]|nr:ORF6N domain-containing protein [Ferruginibacter sp.]